MSHRPDAEEAAHLQYETEHTDPGRGKSVVPYMVILIAAAFVLLLFAFLMQQRTAASVEGLNQSANSFRTIDQLVEDNRALHEEVSRLQKELDQAEEDNEALTDQIAQLQAELEEAKDQKTALEDRLTQLRMDLAAAQAKLAELLPPEESQTP